MNHIELFAGCGGLSLGLHSLGFNLLFANEISPMAAETFVYNFFNENLMELAEKKINPKHTFWLSSNFKIPNDLKKRLRENPKEFPSYYNENEINSTNFLNSLIIADIIDLNQFLSLNEKILKKIQTGFGVGGVDLISGGPPCQSFSLAGLRQHDNEKNSLPLDFCHFVNLIQPKVALLENVSGILRPFKINKEKHYAWFEVAKAFADIDYIPICLHINAKYVGTSQNRPRFIMIAIRKDIFSKIQKECLQNKEQLIYKNSYEFYKSVKNDKNVKYGNFDYYDIDKNETFFSNTFLSPLAEFKDIKLNTAYDAIEDLRNKSINKSSYVNNINTIFGKDFSTLQNHDCRVNSLIVKQRFRLYQILEKISLESKKDILFFLKNTQTSSLKKSTLNELVQFKFFTNEFKLVFLNKDKIQNFISLLATKKRSQKSIIPDKPAPTALSIPDDTCHYHQDELRTLTVREMARIQSFPDSFEFRSKVTTGGKMRRFEVPQYTQVGNAVPPLLGRALGKVLLNLIG